MSAQAFRNTGMMINTASLALVRWIAIGGQLATVFVVHIGFGFAVPLGACLVLILASAMVGVWQAGHRRGGMQMRRGEVFVLLFFDTVQLAALLYLTGGILNPFAILLLAPATISATVLSHRETASLVILVAALASLLAVFHEPLPLGANALDLPVLYIGGLWVALVLATVFVTAYAGILARQSRQLAEGLAEARLTLEREEQMVSLGALATAAAHKLGSPLNTITLIAHDLERVRREGGREGTRQGHDEAAIDEDISQLRIEVERCRGILAELNEDAIHLGQQMSEPQPLDAFVAGLIDERFADIRHMVSIEVAGVSPPPIPPIPPMPPMPPMPEVARRPELIHPIETLIDNAAQFARAKVRVVLGWDETHFSIQVDDDGPGIQSAILARLGEAYISTRHQTDGHMGLGIFIANTMVRHVQGRLEISNIKGGGTRARLDYPRQGFDIIAQNLDSPDSPDSPPSSHESSK